MRAFYFQVKDVVQGRSADGATSHLPPLPLKPGSIEVAWAATIAKYILNILADPLEPDILPDLIRTAICWKAAAHISKVGCKSVPLEDLNNDARTVAFYLVEHPKLVIAKTGFAGLVRLAEEDLSRRQAAGEKAAAEDLERRIAKLRDESSAPPRPVVWQDGPYRVEELTHPFHVWEEGFRMRNCLQGLGRGAIPTSPEGLRSLSYWRGVEMDGRHIYALRKGLKRLATFTHIRSALTEIHVAGDVEEVVAAMTDVVAHLQKIYGPMRTYPLWRLAYGSVKPAIRPRLT